MDYFCRSPEIPDKALATAAFVYLTLRKTSGVFSRVAGTAHWVASKPRRSWASGN